MGWNVSQYEPMIGTLRTRTKAGETPDFFDIVKNKWYTTTGGAELITNGTFDSNTSGWTGVNATLSVSNSTLKVVNNSTNGFARQYITTVVGKKYNLKANLNIVSAYARLEVYSNSGALLYNSGNYSGKLEVSFVANDVSSYIVLYAIGTVNGDYSLFDNISVFEADIEQSTEITESRNYLNHIVYADNDGSPLYVEELPKVEYKDSLNLQNLTYKGNEIGGFLGVNQTWQDVTSSRSAGVTYTNSTGKPIMVTITTGNSSSTSIVYSINGLTSLVSNVVANSGSRHNISFIVPDGNTYLISYLTSGFIWQELR